MISCWCCFTSGRLTSTHATSFIYFWMRVFMWAALWIQQQLQSVDCVPKVECFCFRFVTMRTRTSEQNYVLFSSLNVFLSTKKQPNYNLCDSSLVVVSLVTVQVSEDLLLLGHKSIKKAVFPMLRQHSSFNSKATIHKLGNVLQSRELPFVEEPQLTDKRRESRGFPIQPRRGMKEMNAAANHSSLFTGSFSKPFTSLEGGGWPASPPAHASSE